MPQFERAIGPLWTNWGIRAWTLLLAKDEFIAHRYTTWETWKLALGMQLGGLVADPGGGWRDEPASAPLHGGRGFRHYVVSEIRSITVTVSHGNNYVSILHSGGRVDRYDIQDRTLTRHFMTVLQSMYPLLYRESGIPSTLVGRILKY